MEKVYLKVEIKPIKKIVWALFDSGNGCYKQALENDDRFEVYSIGLDKENKKQAFLVY